jgi:predicted patatin/cPLA2 family phospholipase
MRNDIGLVLEGGGFRGMFTAGVLDVFMERGLQGFSSVWGVSAGALMATSYLSGQAGRSCRINLAYRDDKRYMSTYQLATTGNIVGTAFMYNEVQNDLDPFDYQAFNDNPTRLFATVSDVTFGTPDYVEIDSLPEKMDYVRASASLPVVSRMVEVDGRLLLDGGTTDSVPLARALEEDFCGKAVVVLTQERSYRKSQTSLVSAARKLYEDYPYYLQAIETRPERYNAQREYIWQQEQAGNAFILAPTRPVSVANMEHDGAKLLDLYLQGRTVAQDLWNDLQAFLAE